MRKIAEKEREKVSPERQAYLDKLNKKHNEMDQILIDNFYDDIKVVETITYN
jgi:hypothetical protein